MERLTLIEEFQINVLRRKEAKDPQDRAIYTTLIDMILDEWNRSVKTQEDLAWQEYDGA